MNSKTLKSVYIECISALGNDEYFSENACLLGNATGFFYGYGEKMYLVTNKHVVSGRNTFTDEVIHTKNSAIPNALKVNVNFDIIKQDDKHDYFESTFSIDLYRDIVAYEKPTWFEHHDNRLIDLAVIDVTDKYYKSIVSLKKARNAKLCDWYYYKFSITQSNHQSEVGSQVYVIGFPFGYMSTGSDGWYAFWNNGTIASEYEKKLVVPVDILSSKYDFKKEHGALDAFLIDSRTWSGQSGSPVICGESVNDEITNPIGVYGGRTCKESSLGYVWKFQLVNEIIDQSMKR